MYLAIVTTFAAASIFVPSMIGLRSRTSTNRKWRSL